MKFIPVRDYIIERDQLIVLIKK